jgi:hypothetical protein
MKTCLWIGVLFLAGCVTTKPVSLPSGQQGIAVNCPGNGFSIADCMNKAAQVCGGPYTVLQSSEETAGGAVIPVGNGAAFGAFHKRQLIVSCGA